MWVAGRICAGNLNEALKSIPEKERENSLALIGKRYCDELFKPEQDFTCLAPEQRVEQRLTSSKPLMEEFFLWAKSCRALPKTPVGKAVHYKVSPKSRHEIEKT